MACFGAWATFFRIKTTNFIYTSPVYQTFCTFAGLFSVQGKFEPTNLEFYNGKAQRNPG
jgi:hypothetical protein